MALWMSHQRADPAQSMICCTRTSVLDNIHTVLTPQSMNSNKLDEWYTYYTYIHRRFLFIWPIFPLLLHSKPIPKSKLLGIVVVLLLQGRWPSNHPTASKHWMICTTGQIIVHQSNTASQKCYNMNAKTTYITSSECKTNPKRTQTTNAIVMFNYSETK